MIINKTIILVFLSLFAGACSVTHQYAIEKYQHSKVCCKDMSEFEYYDLTAETPFMGDINEKSQSFNFKSGKSYFIGLKLPGFNQTYKITLKSFALGEHIDKSHIFFPEVLTLNDDFSVISRSPQSAFKIMKVPINESFKENKWGLPVKLETSFIIDSPKIKYLVILTTDSLLSCSTPYYAQRFYTIVLPGIVGAIPSYKERIQIPHSPFGKISVILDEEINK